MDDIFTLDHHFEPIKIGGNGPYHPPEKPIELTAKQKATLNQLGRGTLAPPESNADSRMYYTVKGWKVRGVFLDGMTRHGLVYNPMIQTWFHLWWNAADGKCLTGGCSNGQYDLYW